MKKQHTMATIERVNKVLPKGFILVQGEGYLYFVGPNTNKWFSSKVDVCRVSHLSVERWLEEFNFLQKRYTDSIDGTEAARLEARYGFKRPS